VSTPITPLAAVANPLDVSSVTSDTSRLATRGNLEKAGKQFEAIFTQMMLKSMRATHLADDIFGSKAADTFRDMQDQKIAQSMAEHQPLGIGKAMVDFLAKAQAAAQQATTDGVAAKADEGTTS
jgi:flagellar protein FlgJ